uniref:Retrovirus-related Pol polyprotein from transposon TNT 1-94 n=1 Tax=Cajanus cajan TaxID=3821 RepID=A0A151TKQ1_CAJCA|nr:Retrovirus-related Pol polyprotein from transposon TNT 1-94 [Cajanus cajan]
MATPKASHLAATKRILRYVKGTIEYGILYQNGGTTEITFYSDSNYVGDSDDRRSTSRAVFIIGLGVVSWASRKRSIVSLSNTKAEYIATAACGCQCIWLHRILEHIGIERKESITILCDNNSGSTIQLSKNPVFHGRSKHIAVKLHFLRDLVDDHVVQLKYCNTQEQVADIMTKAVKLEQFEKLRQMLGVVDITTAS